MSELTNLDKSKVAKIELEEGRIFEVQEEAKKLTIELFEKHGVEKTNLILQQVELNIKSICHLNRYLTL